MPNETVVDEQSCEHWTNSEHAKMGIIIIKLHLRSQIIMMGRAYARKSDIPENVWRPLNSQKTRTPVPENGTEKSYW